MTGSRAANAEDDAFLLITALPNHSNSSPTRAAGSPAPESIILEDDTETIAATDIFPALSNAPNSDDSISGALNTDDGDTEWAREFQAAAAAAAAPYSTHSRALSAGEEMKDSRTYLASYDDCLTPSLLSIYVNSSRTLEAPIPIPGTLADATNFTLLGLITEAITSSPAHIQIRKHIIQPLNLTLTYMGGFEANPHSETNLIPGRYHWQIPTFKSTAEIFLTFTSPLTRPNLIKASPSNLLAEWTAAGYLSSSADLTTLPLAIRDQNPRFIPSKS
ncbi:hypothetical protein BJ878DRAFT_551138 [Calycina marina]|uniref:Uncharacterized protein n=1 Tax=Calycina marina TaxID=1763456 RepID=A0A9P8CEJ5_9HELO|nr:hypothetical protein BJ878DRAFT_551138 [Calycina marina]